MNRLFEADPEAFQEKCAAIKAHALEHVRRDYPGLEAAARGGPWEWAQYYAHQSELFGDWKAASGSERSLISQMTQSYMHWLRWQGIMMNWLDGNYLEKGEAAAQLPRVSASEAIEQAGAMAERFNRIFL